MKNPLHITWFALAVAGLPVASSAVVIEGTFSGWVAMSNDLTNYYGRGYGVNLLYGAAVTGTWSYDTDLASADGYPYIDTYGVVGAYGGTVPDWINISITVAGKTDQLHDAGNTGNPYFDAAALDPYLDGTHNSLQVNDAHRNPAAAIMDAYSVSGNDGPTGADLVLGDGTRYRWNEFAGLGFTDYANDAMIVGDGTVQGFDFVAGPSTNATGFYYIDRQISVPGAGSAAWNEQARIDFFITSASAHVRTQPPGDDNPAVPEPSSLILVGLGIIGAISWQRKRPKKILVQGS